jgi:hypothetical protein
LNYRVKQPSLRMRARKPHSALVAVAGQFGRLGHEPRAPGASWTVPSTASDETLLIVPSLPAIVVVVAAILITVGRLGGRWPVAILGFVLLAVAAVLVLLGSSA